MSLAAGVGLPGGFGVVIPLVVIDGGDFGANQASRSPGITEMDGLLPADQVANERESPPEQASDRTTPPMAGLGLDEVIMQNG